MAESKLHALLTVDVAHDDGFSNKRCYGSSLNLLNRLNNMFKQHEPSRGLSMTDGPTVRIRIEAINYFNVVADRFLLHRCGCVP